MTDEQQSLKKISSLLEEVKKLLQQSIAIQLYLNGATQEDITKNLKIRKATINQMVKGIKKEKS